MSIAIRALNAQDDGSLIEIKRDGQKDVLLTASPSLIVREIHRVSADHALLLMSHFSRAKGEVALLDIAWAQIVRRTPLPSGRARRLLRRPDGQRLAVLGQQGIAVLDGETLHLRNFWLFAERQDSETWRLVEHDAWSGRTASDASLNPEGADTFTVTPLNHAAAFRDDGLLRTLSVTRESIDHGRGMYDTYRISLVVADIDADAGLMRRRTLWSGETDTHASAVSEFIAMDPGGTRCLVRHTDLVVTPAREDGGPAGLLKRLTRPADPSAPPPASVCARRGL
ncbi:MAG: hypothetical protein AAF074_25455 [Pseudomonadota bacterium]